MDEPMRTTNPYDIWADRCCKAIDNAGIEPEDVVKFVEAVRAAWNDPTPARDRAPQVVREAMRLAAACLPENKQ